MCDSEKAKELLKNIYESCTRISGLNIRDAYLYGSYARGDYSACSDVDILLTSDLPQEEIERYRRRVAEISSALSLKNDVTVSVTVKPLELFNRFSDSLPYYRNVLREGIRYAV